MRTPRARARDWQTILTASCFAAWLAGTVLSQHPDRQFDRLRECAAGRLLLPDWRFFAPEPGQHDYHVLHRVLTADDEVTPWQLTLADPRRPGHQRSWKDLFWHPDLRHNKALFDVCRGLAIHINEGRDLTQTFQYRLLRDFVERTVRAQYLSQEPPAGCQFMIAQYTGYDDDHEPGYLMVSPFIALHLRQQLKRTGADSKFLARHPAVHACHPRWCGPRRRLAGRAPAPRWPGPARCPPQRPVHATRR